MVKGKSKLCIICRLNPRSSTTYDELFCVGCGKSFDCLPEAYLVEELIEWAVARALKLAPRRQKEALVRLKCSNPNCGKKILRKRATIRIQRQRHPKWKVFCSRQCAGEYRRVEVVSKVCAGCGGELRKRPDKQASALYCSIECMRPEKQNPSVLKTIRNMLKRERTREEIAKRCNVSRSTLRRIIERNGLL